MAVDVILPYNSQPDYDESGWDTYWTLGQWVAWHRGLVKKYGRKLNPGGYPFADAIWLAAWKKHGDMDWSTASPVLAIGQPSRFKEEIDYIRKFPLLYEFSGAKKWDTGINPVDATYRAIVASAKAVSAIGGGITDTITSTGETLSNVTNILKYAIPVVLVLAIGTVMYVGYNKFVKS